MIFHLIFNILGNLLSYFYTLVNKIKNVQILLNTIEPAMSIAAALISSKFPMVGHLDILYVRMNLYGQPPVLKGYFSSATRVTVQYRFYKSTANLSCPAKSTKYVTSAF